MRSNLWPLLKVQLRYSLRGTLENMTGTKSKWGFLLLPLIILGFIPLLFVFTGGWVAAYIGLSAMGQGELILTLALTAGQIVCLVFGILYLISTFYFSNDLKLLVPLPLRPSEIVLSKFIGVLLGEYLTMAPVVLPALGVYGVMADVSWLYIPFALLIYLFLPVVPLVLSGLFSILLMKVSNLRRNRDLIRVFGALIGIGVALFFQMFSRMQTGAQSKEAIEQLLQNQQPMLQSVSKWVVTSTWGTNALRAGATAFGLPSLLLYAAAVAIALVLLLTVAERMFFGGLLGGEESRSSGKQLSREELAKETEQVRSPVWALFLREVKLLNRTPAFLMAGVLPPLLMPFFMIFPLSGPGGPLENGQDLSRFAGASWTPMAVLAALLFLNNLSTIPSSAVSREGRWFWISRSLPVPPRVQVQAKLLHSLIFSTLNLVIILGAMVWLKIMTPFNLVVVVLGGLVGGVVTGYSGLLIDVLRPKLDWTDPQRAMKGNLNSLFAMLVNLILALVTGGVGWLLLWLVPPLFIPGMLILLALEGWALGAATHALAEKRYMEYEY